MNKLKELLSLCKASVTITVNPHVDYYQTVRDYVKEQEIPLSDIDKDIYTEMVMRDILIEIIAYPNSPIGFYTVYHYDIDKAIEQMIEVIKE